MKKLGAEHENLDHKVYRQVKSMILGQKLVPGSKIYQDRLAKELAISRTPLVAALKKLEQERLVTAIARRGFYVARFSAEEMIHIFELREVLEGLAARRSALHITDSQVEKLKSFFKGMKISDDPRDLRRYAEEDRKFHHFLMEVGGNDLLSNILGTYSIITYSYLGSFREGLVRPPKETIHEHLGLIEAISNRDPGKAEELARLHLKLSRDRLMKGADLEELPKMMPGAERGKTNEDQAGHHHRFHGKIKGSIL